MLNSTQPSLYKRQTMNRGYYLILVLCICQFSILKAQWKPPTWHKMPPPRHEYNICFPKDVENNSCKTPTNIPGVFMDELGDDKLAVNISDKIYRTGSESCYKIFRTYTVMNWKLYNERCQLDPMANPVIIDRDAPDYDGVLGEGVCVLVRKNTAYLSQDTIIDDKDIKFELGPLCYDEKGNGFHYRAFMYTQVIKVYDDIRPVVTVPSLPKFPTNLLTCKGALDVTFRASDNCSETVSLELPSIMIAPFQAVSPSAMRMPADFDRLWTWKDNKNGSFSIKIANLPAGKHDLIVAVRDQCGNLSLPTRIPFEVLDLDAPAPTCKQGLAMALMADGQGGAMNRLWASDYIASPAYDCNGQGPEVDKNGLKKITRYSINRVGDKPHIDSSSLLFTCADAGQKINLELHAWDNLGNHGYCVTYVLVQDNRRICPIPPGITGSVATAQGVRMRNVNLNAKHELVAYQTKTDKDGVYRFQDLPEGESYVLRPTMKAGDVNGVTTQDLNLLLEMLQNKLDKFTPYQILAADIDQNGEINSEDFAKLRQIVIFRRDSFPGGNAWRFIPADLPLVKTLKPGLYPDSVIVSNLDSGIVADFMAIKLGDLDGSFLPAVGQAQDDNSSADLSSLKLDAPLANQHKKSLQLQQNQPNPFQDETLISFDLPQAGPINLSVMDLQGRLLYSYRADLPAGSHQVLVNAGELGFAKGVLYYTLRSAQSMETRKMLRF